MKPDSHTLFYLSIVLMVVAATLLAFATFSSPKNPSRQIVGHQWCKHLAHLPKFLHPICLQVGVSLGDNK